MGFLRDRIKSIFFPNYNELTLSMMSLAFLLVFFFNTQLRSRLFKLLSGVEDRVGIIICLLFFTIGMVLSLYHVFTGRDKTPFEKQAMLFFAVVTNAASGIFASVYILRKSTDAPDVFLLLPIWNIINSIILLISWRFNIINERNISDENATPFEILFSFISILVIFVVCQFGFKLYWAITFSICVIYATSFSDALSSVFHPDRKQAAEANIDIYEKFIKAPKGENLEKCRLCRRIIPRAETPWVINRKLIVCKECYDKIQGAKGY